MTSPTELLDANGWSIRLDRQIGLGGEGAVFALANDPDQVAKVYLQPPDADQAAKLTAMARMNRPELRSLAAWPSGLLFHPRTRQLAGFLMPRMSDCHPIQSLYNPVQRLRTFPRAGWNFQIRAAANLAAAFDEVHKAGCVIGDVNQGNAFVSMRATVQLIDCDSFQVRANGRWRLCKVGVAHYIPPELQGKPLRGLVRTENHDCFGLAVRIYQLLFVGRHPYAGIYRGVGDPSFEQFIAEFRFAQGPAAPSWGMAPPPHTPTFADIPRETGALFRRAFERGSEAGNRPRPAEWLAELQRLEKAIVPCATDPGHAYWRGANRCVWCRLAERGGPEYYFGVDGGAATFVVDEAKLAEVVRRLNACGPGEFRYDRRQFAPTRPVTGTPLPNGVEGSGNTSKILAAAIALCWFAVPFGLVNGALCVIGVLGSLVLSVWLVLHIALSPWHRESRRRRAASDAATDWLVAVERRWENRAGQYRTKHAESSESIRMLIADCRGLASDFQAELQRLMGHAEAAARTRHLRLHLIADADIPKIGAGRKQVLAAHNICTADDVVERAISRIKGFGIVLTENLMCWRLEILQQFQFNPATAISPAEKASAAALMLGKQRQLIAEMERLVVDLGAHASTCRAALQGIASELRKAMLACEQAEADLYVLAKKRAG